MNYIHFGTQNNNIFSHFVSSSSMSLCPYFWIRETATDKQKFSSSLLELKKAASLFQEHLIGHSMAPSFSAVAI